MSNFRFSHAIQTRLTPAELWAELDQAMTDSEKSRIWPHELETVHSEGLMADGIISVTYHSPLSSDSKKYRLVEVDPQRSFTYAPIPPHPFSGLVTVSLEELPQGTRLLWKGEYQYRGFPMAYWYFKFFFEKRFFSSLERNLSRFSVK